MIKPSLVIFSPVLVTTVRPPSFNPVTLAWWKSTRILRKNLFRGMLIDSGRLIPEGNQIRLGMKTKSAFGEIRVSWAVLSCARSVLIAVRAPKPEPITVMLFKSFPFVKIRCYASFLSLARKPIMFISHYNYWIGRGSSFFGFSSERQEVFFQINTL